MNMTIIKTRSTKRNFYSSGSDSSDSDTCFSERWKDHIDVLNTVTSSLKEGGIIREEHLKELKSVGISLTRTEIPDLDEVVKDAAQARISQEGTDKAATQVQTVLSQIEIARGAARFLEHEIPLDKGPRKRFLAGEGEARAAELGQLLEDQVIPTLHNVISAYIDLRQASVESDSENSIHSDADSGEGE